MRFTKSQISGAERKLKEPWPRYGYCKACRTRELLVPEHDICFCCFEGRPRPAMQKGGDEKVDNILLIGIVTAKQAALREDNLESRLKAAMKEMKNFWASTDEDLRFMAAVGGVLELSEGEDADRIRAEIRALRAISSASAGVPVNFSLVKVENPIGLLRMWKEISE